MECLESWEAASSSSGFETVQFERLQVIPVQRGGEVREGMKQIKLLEGQGWGDGQHPSTWMCLDFLEKVIQGESLPAGYGRDQNTNTVRHASFFPRHFGVHPQATSRRDQGKGSCLPRLSRSTSKYMDATGVDQLPPVARLRLFGY